MEQLFLFDDSKLNQHTKHDKINLGNCLYLKFDKDNYKTVILSRRRK